MRILTILAALVVAGLANFALWSFPNRPVPLEPVPGGKLKSVSFAPFRDGQSPLTKDYPTPQQIEEDLKVISAQVAGIRTYTSLEGLEVVPELAKKHGLQVTMGAWLSSRQDKNEAEVASLIELANRYPDTITRVIVGNEVLLRGELTAEQISGYIRKVKAAIRQPVSYADVWEWWLKYPEMAKEVDIITIHLLPYWEDIPASVEKAPEHIVHSYREIAHRFPGKPILVGETGWPTAGRTRGASEPGLVNKAKFVNAFVRLAEKEGFDYNIIEAFDQNWKQKLEGTVGGHWGLYTVDREAKFTLSGPVVEDVSWPRHLGISIAAGAALFAALLMAGPALAPSGIVALAFLTQGLSSAYVHAADISLHWAYYWYDEALAYAMLALGAVLGGALLLAARRVGEDRRLAAEPLRPLHHAFGAGSVDRIGTSFATLLAVVAIVWSLLIVFDGRYRNFPNIHYAIPAFGLAALGLLRLVRRPSGTGWRSAFAINSLFRPAVSLPDPGRRGFRPEAWIARALVACAVLIVIAEGILPVDAPLRGWWNGTSAMPLSEIDWSRPNWEALSWAALQLLLALPFSAGARLAARTEESRTPAAGVTAR